MRTTRRSSTARLFALCITTLLFLTAIARADLPDDVSPQVDGSIANGLAFLAKQQHADGSFDGGGPKVAMTGLSLMGYLAAGNVADEGRYGLVVRSAEEFLLKSLPPDGYYGKVDGSRMYGHGIATLALAEAYGADPDPARRRQIRAALDKAVKVILDAQAVPKGEPYGGGWRYEPQSPDADLSLSGWNALALHACESLGAAVPKDRVGRAVGFVLKCFRKDQGGFGYQPGRDSSGAMTGVGTLNLFLLDAADRPEAAAGGKWLLAHPVTDDTQYLYYTSYYATQAAFQAGGDTWIGVWKTTQARLLAAQDKDGGWPQSRTGEEPGRVYATSLSVLALTVPYRLLPIYQR